MFRYKLEKRKSQLFVYLPNQLDFGLEFVDELTYVFKLATGNMFKAILFSSDPNAKYDKLCLAYLDNALKYIAKTKRVYLNLVLQKLILKTVVRKSSNEFQEIILANTIINGDIPLYVFDGYNDVSKTVNNLVDVLVDKNIVVDRNQIKEFLSTTIGEIFSNAINHSNQKNFFFAYDLIYDNSGDEDDFYLEANVIDYGNTLIRNVQLFFEKQDNRVLNSEGCFLWAIEEGHTTREGSGGFGLPTFISYLKAVNGEMMIFSGDAICILKDQDIQVITSKGNFPGTSVTFRVKLFDVHNCLLCKKQESKISFQSINLDDI